MTVPLSQTSRQKNKQKHIAHNKNKTYHSPHLHRHHLSPRSHHYRNPLLQNPHLNYYRRDCDGVRGDGCGDVHGRGRVLLPRRQSRLGRSHHRPRSRRPVDMYEM